MNAVAMRPTLKVFGTGLFAVACCALADLSGDLRDQIVEHIDAAQSSIDVVVYEIRSSDIADALIAAKRRGVRVRVIVDSVHSPVATPQEKAMEEEGIPVKRVSGTGRKRLHDKFILFDGSEASTPSYNRSAKSLREKDNEDDDFTYEKSLIQKLKSQFDDFWTSSGQPEVPQN